MEYRKRCKVCGQIWCYTDQDLKQDLSNGVTSILHGIGGIAAGLGGNIFQQQYAADRMENDERKRVNRNQCPHCKSLDSEDLTEEAFKEYEAKKNFAGVTVTINANASTDSLLKRVELLLEDKDWATANAYCDNILDTDPENATAYLYKLMAELQVSTKDDLRNVKAPLDEKANYQKILRFGNVEIKNAVQSYNQSVKDRIEEERVAGIYNYAVKEMESNTSEEFFRILANKFESIKDYKDSLQRQQLCLEKAEEAKKAAEKAKKARKQKLIIAGIVLAVIAAIIAVISVSSANEAKKEESYNKAISMAEAIIEDDVFEAIEIFGQLGDYKDSAERLEKAKEDIYNSAKQYLGWGLYNKALELFRKLNDYKDCPKIVEELGKEAELFEEVYNAETIDAEVIEKAKNIIENSKYISIDWFEDKVKCLYDYDNKNWTYVSGDPTAISRSGKNPNVRECKNITTVFSKYSWESESVTISDGNEKFPSIGISKSSHRFVYNEETNTLTMKETAYISADITVVFSSSDTLEITVETKDKNVYTCTYKKVQ
ncbi:MAG: hypothetical protein IKB88_11895 [Clostridia bacterium]|nr:hypothetical protein [Clostridia bacterium]